jgi:hypothetical protein
MVATPSRQSFEQRTSMMLQDCSTVRLAGATTDFLPRLADVTMHVAPGIFVLIEIVCEAAIAGRAVAVETVARTRAVPIVCMFRIP